MAKYTVGKEEQMSNLARCTTHLALGTVFLAPLFAQNLTADLPIDLYLTGSESAWVWGKNTFAQEIDARKFHLWRLNHGKMIASILPPELETPVQDLVPGVSFLDDKRGFVVWTQDRVIKDNRVRFTLSTAETLDGGHSWQVQRQSINAGFTFTGVHQVQFTDIQNGHVIVGIDGAMGSTFKTLLHTSDGGRHWRIDPASQTVVGSENAPIHMLFRSRSEGWILTAGVHGQPYPNIFLSHTRDGGRSWDSFNKFVWPPVCQPNCSVENVSSIYFDEVNVRAGFFLVHFLYTPAGSFPMKNVSVRYRTHDGGANWSAPERLNAPGRDWTFADFESGLSQHGARFFLTGNGGRTWSYNPALSHILAPYRSSMLNRELHRRKRSLWLVAEAGEGSVLIHSDDDGGSWRAVSTHKEPPSSGHPVR